MKFSLSEINEVIRSRRSIYPKQFSSRKVHAEQIQVMIENARWAPSHRLTEPWRFVVFQDDAKNDLGAFHAALYEKESGESFNAFKKEKILMNASKSSAIISVVLKRDELKRVPRKEEYASVSCAVQNLHLTATAFGIGGYWGTGAMTYHPEMRAHLGFEEQDEVVGFFYLGYPEIEWPRKQVRKQVREITEWRDK